MSSIERHEHPSGIYALPVVGPQAQRVRDVADGLVPGEDDSAGVKVGKNLVRGGVVVGGGAIVVGGLMIACL